MSLKSVLIRDMLFAIGENPDRDGLRDTPGRVVKSWSELYAGYDSDPKSYLEKTFDVSHDQLICVNDIEFFSTCEHHMLPFFGTADVAYLPSNNGKVVGLSKIARLVDGYARRLQVQERLTDEIANAINEVLKPRAVAVRVRAKHFCMVARGIKSNAAKMSTTALRGEMLSNNQLKSEWIAGLPK